MTLYNTTSAPGRPPCCLQEGQTKAAQEDRQAGRSLGTHFSEGLKRSPGASFRAEVLAFFSCSEGLGGRNDVSASVTPEGEGAAVELTAKTVKRVNDVSVKQTSDSRLRQCFRVVDVVKWPAGLCPVQAAVGAWHKEDGP